MATTLAKNIINMHEAKTHLSRLANEVHETGHPIVISKAGRPWVMVVPLPDAKPQFGFMRKELAKVDTSCLEGIDEDVQTLFYGESK
jgi:prevent-host-death family protein